MQKRTQCLTCINDRFPKLLWLLILCMWLMSANVVCVVGPNHFSHCVKVNQREWGKGRNGNPWWLSSNTRHPVYSGNPGWDEDHQNCIHLQLTKEESVPVASQAWEAARDASIPIMPSHMDMGIEAKVAEPQHDILLPARNPISWSTYQKEPTDSTSSRAPYWNCLDVDIFKLGVSSGQTLSWTSDSLPQHFSD